MVLRIWNWRDGIHWMIDIKTIWCDHINANINLTTAINMWNLFAFTVIFPFKKKKIFSQCYFFIFLKFRTNKRAVFYWSSCFVISKTDSSFIELYLCGPSITYCIAISLFAFSRSARESLLVFFSCSRVYFSFCEFFFLLFVCFSLPRSLRSHR